MRQGDDEHEDEDVSLLARLNNGRDIPVKPCECSHCGNEWFMASYSAEWMPNYCPYCGVKFKGRMIDGVPGPFLPKKDD